MVFSNVIRPNGLNDVSELSHFSGGVMLKRIYPPFYRSLFDIGSVVVFSGEPAFKKNL